MQIYRYGFDRTSPFNIEGGDELVLSKDVLAIGISERTSAEAIERLARNIFKDDYTTFKKYLRLKYPIVVHLCI